jgi:hypothetical protein
MLNTFCSFCGRSSREVKKMMRSHKVASVGGAERSQIGSLLSNGGNDVKYIL